MSVMAASLAASTWLVLAGALGARLTPRRSVDRRGEPPHRAATTVDASQLADLLSAIAADTRTGTSLTTALAAHESLDRTVAAHRPGRRIGDARDLEVVRHAVATARALGGPPASTLDAAAALLRERAAHRAEAAVHSAQARLSARVLTGVPLGFTLWSALTSPSFRAALASPIGVTAAMVGAALNLSGWRWMRRSIQRAAP